MGFDAVNANPMSHIGNHVSHDPRVQRVSEDSLPHIFELVVLNIVRGAASPGVQVAVETDPVVRKVDETTIPDCNVRDIPKIRIPAILNTGTGMNRDSVCVITSRKLRVMAVQPNAIEHNPIALDGYHRRVLRIIDSGNK